MTPQSSCARWSGIFLGAVCLRLETVLPQGKQNVLPKSWNTSTSTARILVLEPHEDELKTLVGNGGGSLAQMCIYHGVVVSSQGDVSLLNLFWVPKQRQPGVGSGISPDLGPEQPTILDWVRVSCCKAALLFALRAWIIWEADRTAADLLLPQLLAKGTWLGRKGLFCCDLICFLTQDPKPCPSSSS